MCRPDTKKRSLICAESSQTAAEAPPLALWAARHSMLARRSNHRQSVSATMYLGPSWPARVVRLALLLPHPLPRSSNNLPSTRCLRDPLHFRGLPHLHRRRLSSRDSNSIPRVLDPAASRHSLRRQQPLRAPARGAVSVALLRAARLHLKSTLRCLTRDRDSRLRSRRTLPPITLAHSSTRLPQFRFKTTL